MTVLPFRTAASSPARGAGPPSGTADLVGTFPAPSGARGSFTGSYRLERLVDQFGQLAAAGIFTGELHDADGTQVGLASRRLTCAAVVAEQALGLHVDEQDAPGAVDDDHRVRSRVEQGACPVPLVLGHPLPRWL